MTIRFKGIYWLLLIAGAAYCMATSCKKDKILTTGGQLKFSVDTLTFDTVFTAAGSFTTSMKIYNPASQDIVISSITLENGSSTYFHLNVDGFAGNTAKDIRIAAHDSIYVFATVNIDPTNANTPFVVTDRLVATFNGKTSYLPFEAYGQNAHYVIDSEITSNQTWLTDRPYVILHSVVIDSAATLTIPGGCHVYLNQDSRIFVLGKLLVNPNGNAQDTVVFQGDRLDRAYFGYEGYPGEWGGIYFDANSKGNIIRYAVLKNCGGATSIRQSDGTTASLTPAAIQLNVDTQPDINNPQLKIDHSIIENSIGYGILSFGGTMQATNCLIHTCGAQALALIQGGVYYVANCSFVNYGTNKVSHTDNSTVIILNYYAVSETQYIPGALYAEFHNNIVWGSLAREIVFDRRDGALDSVILDNSLLKVDTLATFINPINCIINRDPQFINYASFDFHIGANSPAAGAGKSNANVPLPITNDLDDRPRTDPPDIGCYQH